MHINISTRHGHLSDATRAKITAKVERLARMFDRLQAIEVTVDMEHENAPSVDLQVSAEHKHDFVATDSAANVMAGLDGAIHKIEQQLRKYKEKVQDHHRTPGLRQQASAQPEPETSSE